MGWRGRQARRQTDRQTILFGAQQLRLRLLQTSVCCDGPAPPQGSFSVPPAIATQLLAAFPTDSAEGIEGTAVRFLVLKCPFGRKPSHSTAVQHCLSRTLGQTVAPFSFLIGILV